MGKDEIATELAAATRTVAAGKAAEGRRAALMQIARQVDPEYWTQVRLAAASGISQAAVSKLLARDGVDVYAHNIDPAYLIGRFLGIAYWVEQELWMRNVKAECESLTDKLTQGRIPPTESELSRLRQLLAKDFGKLPAEPRRAAMAALASVDETADGPLGAVNLTQTEQMRLIFGMDKQRIALRATCS